MPRSTLLALLGPFVALALLAGCERGAAALSSHTVQVGPTEEADVLWVQKGGVIYRCTGRGERPVCTPVPAD